MRESRFTDTQIVGVSKEQGSIEAPNGMATAETCRKHGLSKGTFYAYKSK